MDHEHDDLDDLDFSPLNPVLVPPPVWDPEPTPVPRWSPPPAASPAYGLLAVPASSTVTIHDAKTFGLGAVVGAVVGFFMARWAADHV